MTETAPTAPPTLTTAIEPVAVDTSSALSPSSPKTKAALEARLSRRPEQKDLLDRNILHTNAAATSVAFAQHKDELKHAMLTDNLKKGLSTRPERKQLEERGILPDDNVAPALLTQKKELEKNMLSDTLNSKLSKRPSPDDLVQKGILAGA
ncbi:hypothetical protein ABW20_dc0105592 [Dactylellina cionopaga]|nr:hypothetical protein ABW20_dc0105592 [Dactylellina cionopaga]